MAGRDKVQAKFSESVDAVLSEAKTLFLNEFHDVLLETGSEFERRLASVPGLIIALFQHGQVKKRKKRSLGRVTFSEEINTDFIESYEESEF